MDEINKEIQARMEFIVNQQAQFAANIQVHDGRLTRLENIVTRFANLSLERFEQLTSAQQQTEEKMSTLADKMAELAEAQAHTDKRLDALIDIVREGRNGKA